MPLAPQTTPDLFSLIQSGNLVPADRLSQYLQEQPLLSLPSQPDLAVQRLVKDGLLSDFQAQLLLLGQSDGLTLGRYRLTRLIGRGGMSSVFLADDTKLNRPVAVKIFTVDDDESALQKRFEREAKAAAAVDHANVVKAYDFGEDGRRLYLVMEYVAGTDLHKIVKGGGALPLELACHYIRQAAEGLKALHAAGLIHRDVKPSNFLATNDGVIKLCDLGIVRFLTKEHEPITALHLAGSFLGTPQFLAPEHLEDSHNADHRADIYGLGATLYYLLTAKPPRRTMLASGDNVLTRPTPIARRRPDLPVELAEYIDRMLSDDPAARPKSAGDVARDLERYAIGPIAPTRPLESSLETRTNASLDTNTAKALPPLKNSSLTYRPVTESTPTLPCGDRRLVAEAATTAPRKRTSWVWILSLTLLAFAVISIAMPRPTASLEEQVRLRIETDKAMNGATVKVVAVAPGQIVLQGSVKDQIQKKNAVQIAEHTAGVESVKDELLVK